MGRKSLRFCAWLFRVLGMRAGDELHDLFPGTGVVGRAWALASKEGMASLEALEDASLSAERNVLPLDDNDGRGLQGDEIQ